MKALGAFGRSALSLLLGLVLSGTATRGVAAEEGMRTESSARVRAGEVSAEVDLRARRIARRLTRRAGERRPEDQLRLWLFERPLTVGGEIESVSRFRGDFKLDPHRADDELDQTSKLELELFYPATESTAFFLEGKVGYQEILWSEDGAKQSDWRLQRGEAWAHFANIEDSGVSLQLGRQVFKDKREWWWDSELDAVRLFYDTQRFSLQAAVAEELAPLALGEDKVAAPLEDVLLALGQATWFWTKKNRVDLFAIHRDDRSRTHVLGDIVAGERRDAFDGRLSWLGARALGRVKVRPLGAFHYWLDAAMVRGTESRLEFDEIAKDAEIFRVTSRTDARVQGWALDGGVTWDPRRSYWPRLTLGYAIGSGDDGTGGRDRAFRQTGIHDNNGKYRGVDRFKYYGELFRPELSNLRVLTASVGFPILRSSSVELLYHRYRQDEAAPFLRSSKLKARPTGGSRSLGEEWDLVIGLEEWAHWEIELVGALFRSGRAFGTKENEYAQLAILKVDFNF